MKNKKLYMILGILTLIVAVAGATFAYFTASQSNSTAITGDSSIIDLKLDVIKKTTIDNKGLIPMTNSMIQAAVSNASNKGICVDDNDNTVCQIYKITVQNTSTSSIFTDGYVTLTGGTGVPTDYSSSPTTMRWSQVFCTESGNNLQACTTAGSTTVRQTNNISWNALGTGTGHDTTEIKDAYNNVVGTGTISGNSYDVINTNYIRVSKHSGTTYSQTNDVTSALVYNQYLPSNDNTNNDTGDSSSTYVDSQVYYIAVWISENGNNQTIGSKGTNVPDNPEDIFSGTVTFNSSEGSKVTATFGGYSQTGNNNQSSSTTKYTVNVPDDFDNWTTTNPKIVWIDNPIPSGVTQYDTASAARAAFSNRPIYLKHTIVNDIVTESYVEFVVTDAMAQANSGMTAGTYTLRGAGATSNGSGGYNNDSPYYAANVAVLKQAFGENSGYCSDFTSSSYVRCTVSGLDAGASSDGIVDSGEDSAHCNVYDDGSADCGVE